MQETQVGFLGREDPWRRQWQPAPVFLPGESPGQRSLAGYSPWGRTESDTAKVTESTEAPAASQRLLWLQQSGLAVRVSLQPQLRACPVSSHVRDYCELPKCVSSFPGYRYTTLPSLLSGAWPWDWVPAGRLWEEMKYHVLAWPIKPPSWPLALSLSLPLSGS